AAAPKMTGIAYVAGHGGHLAVLNLANGELDRINVTPPAGLNAEGKPNPIVGTHGQVLKGRDLYIGLLNGKIMKYNLDSGELKELAQHGKKLCGAVTGPDGNIYFEDMADGNVYVFDPVKDKPSDVIPVGKSLCGIGWDKSGRYAFVTDMIQGNVYVLDMKTKRTIKTIEDVGIFLHQSRTTPDKSELWVTAANEFKQTDDKKDPWATAGKGKSEIVIIDTEKMTIKERFATEEGIYPHDLAFTPDGKYALLTARTYGDDSVLVVYDMKTKETLSETSLCKSCHDAAGVKVTIDKGSPLLCGIEVDWSAKK
ncbi:MAG TPA: cytochrome D1 domain-containing protein, partial [Nitrospirota bacterium]|nr:cytochrome D1 domain-containing protein [Nitrospirota bacterium]